MSKHRLAAAVVLVILILSTAFMTKSFFPVGDKTGKGFVAVYFLNSAAHRLDVENRPIEELDNVRTTTRVLNMLLGEPQNKNLSRVAPEGMAAVNNGYLVRNEGDPENGKAILEIEFSSDYFTMTPTEELFFRAAFVWTMTGLDFIKGVHIYVDGQELLKPDGSAAGILTRDNVVINKSISPVKTDIKRVRIYLTDVDSTVLVAEDRRVVVDPDQPTEKYVIEQLIKGSTNSNLSATVPPETKIRGEIKTEDGICYVNLSNDFQTRQKGSPAAVRISVYSIVNSLTELPNVNKVQLLIEAEKIESFKGAVDLSKPLERDESYIQE